MRKFQDIDFETTTDKYIAAIDPGFDMPAIYIRTREYIKDCDTGYDLHIARIPSEEDALEILKNLA